MSFRPSIALAILLGPVALLCASGVSAQSVHTGPALDRQGSQATPVVYKSHTFADAPAYSSTSNGTAAATDGSSSSASSAIAPPVAIPVYQGPTFAQTLGNYVKESVSFRNFIDAGLISGMPNLPVAPSQPMAPSVLNSTTGPAYENSMSNYGDGMDNWRRNSEVELRYRARRAGVGIATEETRNFLGDLVLPLALREDGRYVPANLDQHFGSRIGHAFAAPLITRTPGGHLIPNYAHIGATFAAGAIGEHFYASALNVPQLQTSNFLWKYTGYTLAGDVATNVARELVRSAIKSDLQQFARNGESTEAHYYPLSIAGKAANWARSTYSPRHFVSAALLAGMPQYTSQPDYPSAPPINTTAQELAYDQSLIAYGNNLQSWRRTTEENMRYTSRRAIGGFAESETQGFMTQFLFPVLFRQESRYTPTGGGSFGARVGHAFTSLAVARQDSGKKTLNVSLIAGTGWAAYIADKSYYPALDVPHLATAQVFEKTVGFNLAGDLLLNLVHEFMPQHSF